MHLKGMKIIDNKKDYYDYLSGIYGIDDLAVYDRRCSVTWPNYKERFRLFFDPKRVKEDEFIPNKKRSWCSNHMRFLCVEAGFRQFLIMAERILANENAEEVEIRRSLLGSRIVEEKHSDAPLSVFECAMSMAWRPPREGEEFNWSDLRYWDKRYCYYRLLDTEKENSVENPILAGSFIATMIPGDDIWHGIYEYLMSLNDKKIVDNRPDALKVEAAGFDLKTSFRNTK